MKVLVLNSGSSSIKFQVLKMPSEAVLVKGLLERIGGEALLKLEIEGSKTEFSPQSNISSHKEGFQWIVDVLEVEGGISAQAIEVVGHRVVHGGTAFNKATFVSDYVKQKIDELSSLAPLHNPSNLLGIEVAEEVFKNARQIAVFDTAFYQTLPPVSFRFSIPNKYYREENIRKYGFHGTSHAYVAQRTYDFLQTQKAKIITLHLGNGCSITAHVNGRAVEHSLGFTPNAGLMMGTRSGDIDVGAVLYLQKKYGLDPDDLDRILNKESGLLGLTGLSDMRDVLNAAHNGDNNCQLALDLFVYRTKQFIGAYVATMNGLDALVFTAGIGENSPEIRRRICQGIDYLGINVSKESNRNQNKSLYLISEKRSKTPVLVVATNEELEIAKQSYNIVVKGV